MADEKYTRCPACGTVFRVTEQQLGVRSGQVRCGHCQAVFDGRAELLPVVPSTRTDEPQYDEATMGPPTMTLRMPPGEAPAGSRPVHFEERFSWDKRRRRQRVLQWAYAVGTPLLLLLVAGQAAFHYRDWIAARWPVARPTLARACALIGCAVRPVREAGSLSIAASDLQADAAHRGLLVLTASLRNHAPWPLSYPHLELTLTDSRDQTVARRVLLPGDYAGGTADLQGGIPGNGEVQVKLFIDASATSQAGYRLYLFYP